MPELTPNIPGASASCPLQIYTPLAIEGKDKSLWISSPHPVYINGAPVSAPGPMEVVSACEYLEIWLGIPLGANFVTL